MDLLKFSFRNERIILNYVGVDPQNRRTGDREAVASEVQRLEEETTGEWPSQTLWEVDRLSAAVVEINPEFQ